MKIPHKLKCPECFEHFTLFLEQGEIDINTWHTEKGKMVLDLFICGNCAK